MLRRGEAPVRNKMQKYNVKVNLVTENGNPLTEFHKDGKVLVEARHDSKYGISISNLSSTRKEVLITVDGLDVIKGNPADFSTRGYILDAWQSTLIKGWRIDDNKIREFVFGTKKESYSNKVGEGTQNTGVIGVAVFDEYVAPKPVYEDYYAFRPRTFVAKEPMFMGYVSGGPTSAVNHSDEVYRGLAKGVSSGTLTARSSMGTQMGNAVDSRVSHTYFTRAEQEPATIFEFYYFSKRELQSMGVLVKRIKPTPSLPQAFPKQYCREV
jgi:hypothetical protein